MSEQKIEQKIDKDSKAEVVSSLSKVPSNGSLAKEQAAKLVKGKKGKGKGAKKAEVPTSIAGTLSNRLKRFEDREKVLEGQIAQREKYLAKLTKNLEVLKTALAKTKKDHSVQLCAIKDLMQTLNGKVA